MQICLHGLCVPTTGRALLACGQAIRLPMMTTEVELIWRSVGCWRSGAAGMERAWIVSFADRACTEQKSGISGTLPPGKPMVSEPSPLPWLDTGHRPHIKENGYLLINTRDGTPACPRNEASTS